MHNTFSVLNNIHSVDEVQQVEYLPAQFDYNHINANRYDYANA